MEGSIRCLDCKPKPRLIAKCTCRGETRRELRVHVGKDPVTRKRIDRSRTVLAGKRDAQTQLNAFIAEILDERERGTVNTTSTLGELMGRWLRHVEDKDRGKGTIKNYRQHARAVACPLADILADANSTAIEAAFERHGIDDPIAIRPTAAQRQRFVRLFFDDQIREKRHTWATADFVLGDVKLDRLIDEHIEAYYDALQAIGRSPRTVNGYHASIRAALNLGLAKKWIAGNPAIGTARPPLRDPELVVPTPAQVVQLVAAATAWAPEWGAFLRVAAGTWARRGEIVALRSSAINLERREVVIAHSVSRDQGFKDTKTHATRRLRVDADTAAAIADHLARLEDHAAKAGVALVDDPFLFSDEPDGSRPWHPDTPSRFFEDVRDRAGIAGVRLHDLRHFGATQAISAGMPITGVAKRLGHSKVTTTLNVYAHWLPADDDDLADLMGDLLSGRPELRVVV